jgi:PAS domain S-box-containing protein
VKAAPRKSTRRRNPGSTAVEKRGEERQAENASFPVVGIGASAGGLKAFRQLLEHLPIDTGMAFVLVKHLDPAHESILTELLSGSTRLPVSEVRDGMAVEPDHVYVIPRNTNMAIAEGRLRLLPREEARMRHRPIDYFLRTLAEEQKHRAIGVILSGTASDGTLGLEAIKAEGGITFAQDPRSARYDGMPRSAIAAGHVDFILTPEGIAAELARISRHPYVIPTTVIPLANDELYNRNLELTALNAEIEESRDYAEAIISAMPVPLVIMNADLRVHTANDAFYNTFKVSPGESEGRLIFDLGNGQWNIPRLREMLNDILSENSFFNDFEVTHAFEAIGRRTMLLNARMLSGPHGNPLRILLGIQDVTERKHTEEMRARLAAIVESSDDAIISADLNGVITSWNAGAERLYGYTTQETIGQPLTIIIPRERLDEETAILERISRAERVEHYETVRRRKDGALLEVSLAVSPIMNTQRQVIGASKIARNITARKQAEEALRESHVQLQSHAEELARFNSVAVGRELRMIELKKEVNELCRQQGQAARYPLEFEKKKKNTPG